MEEKKIKQKDMCRTVDCDKLAVTIFDAFKFKEDREESGINEIAKGMDTVLQDYVDPEKKQAIDHVFMALTGYMLETLISMSV